MLLSFDCYYKSLNALDTAKRKIAASKITNEEVSKEAEKEMEIKGFEHIPKLFITPIESLMDEFKSSVKELRGLFTIPKANVPTGNLHQQICNTAKMQFDQTNGDCSLFGFD